MFPADLLPLQPIPPDAGQHDLAARHLSDLSTVHRYFQSLRSAIDQDLAPRFPEYDGKPYPLGRCREIRDEVYERLVAHLNAPTCPVSLALQKFVLEGGIGRKIWGVLRDSYFQNAIQLGPLYVDVANDTVNPRKPQVEILPLEISGMVAVEDFFHFARTAERYWEYETFANTALPGLAALFPVICVNCKREVWLAAESDQMLALTRAQSYRPSLEFVREAPPASEPLVRFLRERAARGTHERLQFSGDSGNAIEADIAASRFADQEHYRSCVVAFRELQRLLLA